MADTENVANSNMDATTEQVDTEAAESTEGTTEVAEVKADPVKAEQEKPAVVELDPAKFTLPEGFQMDKQALEEFMPLAKELGLNQDNAQKAISLHAKAIGAVMTRMTEHRDNAYTEVMEGIKSDKVLGGDKWEQNIGRVNAVIAKFGGEADTFHAAIAQVAGFDKEKAKSMYVALDKMARAASVDDALIGGGSTEQVVSLADAMFPTTKSK